MNPCPHDGCTDCRADLCSDTHCFLQLTLPCYRQERPMVYGASNIEDHTGPDATHTNTPERTSTMNYLMMPLKYLGMLAKRTVGWVITTILILIWLPLCLVDWLVDTCTGDLASDLAGGFEDKVEDAIGPFMDWLAGIRGL